MAMALRRCPHAVVRSPRFEAYQAASDQAFAVFARFSPRVEALSIDEAFLDMTGTERLLGPPQVAAEALRQVVREETRGLTCSVGISSVKFIAKIASDLHKPDGITDVPPGTELAFLEPLPIAKLWGVGPKAQARLHAHDIRTVGDLRKLACSTLEAWFGEHGRHLWRLSNAIDERAVEPGQRRKQISHEDTYASDVVGSRDVRRKLLSQATRVADRLVAKNIRGRRVSLKMRDTTFKTETRQSMLSEPTCEAKVIYAAVCALLEGVELEHRAFRLTGVSVSALQDDAFAPPQQLELLQAEDGPPRGQQLQEVLSAVRRKFGHQALYPADASASERPGSAGALTRTRDTDDPAT
jgi:DNA polymerase-4